MIGRRSDGYATCRLVKPMSLPTHMREGIVELTKMHTRKDQRGRGHATALMRIVCDEADAHGKVLMLKVEPDAESPVDHDALVKFYASYGFNTVQETPTLMARAPGGDASVQ